MSSQISIFTHQGFGRLSFEDHSGFCVVGLARKRFCLKFHCSFEDLFVSNDWGIVFRSFWKVTNLAINSSHMETNASSLFVQPSTKHSLLVVYEDLSTCLYAGC